MSEAPVGWFRALVIDAHDPERLSQFWQALLGVGVIETVTDWIQLGPDRGGVYLAFQPLADGASRRTTLRPDIEVADMDIAQARIVALGGKLIEIIQEPTGETHRRMVDPEGNEFTILAPLPDELHRQVYGS